jgi:hypothetical protein
VICRRVGGGQFACFFSGGVSGRRHISGCGWQAMPMFEQATTPESRWQMTQRSVHTAQPAMPDCVEPPALGRGVGSGTGPSSSAAAGGGVAGDDASDDAAAGGAAAGGGAGVSEGVAAPGDCADVHPEGAGASAAAADSTATAAPSANATARATVTRAIVMRAGVVCAGVVCAGVLRDGVLRDGAWVHEPIVFLPRSPPVPAGRPKRR